MHNVWITVRPFGRNKEWGFMGWEFVAVWFDPARVWKWMWRRLATDSGSVLEQSPEFGSLDACVADAGRKGFKESGCGPVDISRV